MDELLEVEAFFHVRPIENTEHCHLLRILQARQQLKQNRKITYHSMQTFSHGIYFNFKHTVLKKELIQQAKMPHKALSSMVLLVSRKLLNESGRNGQSHQKSSIFDSM